MVNFGDIPERYAGVGNSKIVILPVPYDGTSTWMKGADRGPGALIEASANLELYDIETGYEVYRLGIFTDTPLVEEGHPGKMVDSVCKRATGWLDRQKFLVTIGGEHTVSIGAVKAHALRMQDLSVLQIDAHADLRDEYDGLKFSHACVMARVGEFCPFVQVGIRSLDRSEKDGMDPGRVFWAHEIRKGNEWMDRAIGLLSGNVYVTIDLDGLDPSIMPSTGTPEPGGLTWYQVLELMKKLIADRTLVGFDITELCPVAGNRAPDFLAAKLLYKILSYRFQKERE